MLKLYIIVPIVIVLITIAIANPSIVQIIPTVAIPFLVSFTFNFFLDIAQTIHEMIPSKIPKIGTHDTNIVHMPNIKHITKIPLLLWIVVLLFNTFVFSSSNSDSVIVPLSFNFL